jgi:hypothetical protein
VTFKKGESGNPEGRPKGTLNKRSQLGKLLEPYAEQLVTKAIELALNGDANALRLCMERLIPKVRSEAIEINLPEIDPLNPEILVEVGARILKAVANQEITPEQGKALSELLEAQRKNIEIFHIETRITEVERALKLRT